ncbi:hypothetical protein GCM10027442_24310 [Emticicia fontis]
MGNNPRLAVRPHNKIIMTEEKRKSSQKKSDKQNTVKIPVTQIASEKVDATVTTFLSEDLYGLKMIQRNDQI